jgi:hypothetical protein
MMHWNALYAASTITNYWESVLLSQPPLEVLPVALA